MASAVIGALRVVMGADTAQWEQALDKAQLSLGSLSKFAGLAGAAIGGALAAAGVAVGIAVKGMIDRADDMNDMSQRIGVPVEQLTALEHAANMSGVTLESFGKAMQRVSLNMTQAAVGGGKAAGAFDALGIKVLDSEGKLRTHIDVMGDIAEKFATMENGAGKTALAMTIFGKSGAELIPMLNEGRDGIKEMTDEAAELGLVISTDTAQAADQFNDNLTRLTSVKQGLTTMITARLLPALVNFTDMLTAAMKNTKLMDAAANILAGTFRVLVTAGIIVGSTFAGLGRIVGAAAIAVVRAAKGDFGGAWQAIKDGAADFNTIGIGMGDAVVATWAKTANNIKVKAPALGDAMAAPLIAGKEKASKASDALKKTADEMKRMMEEASRIIEGLQSPHEKAAREFTENSAVLRRELDAGRLSADAYNDALTRLSLKREAAMGGFDKLKVDQNPQGFINTPQIAAELGQAITDKAAEARDQFGEAFGSAFSNGVEAAARGDLKGFLVGFFQDIGRSALSSLGNLIGKGLFDSMKGGGGGGFGSLFASLGKLLPGFASGGSMIVGGRGGTDKNIVAFRATRGERVDIHAKGADRGGAGVMQYFTVNAQGAILAEGLKSEMQNVGVRAAVGGAQMGQRNTESTMARRQTRRLGVG